MLSSRYCCNEDRVITLERRLLDAFLLSKVWVVRVFGSPCYVIHRFDGKRVKRERHICLSIYDGGRKRRKGTRNLDLIAWSTIPSTAFGTCRQESGKMHDAMRRVEALRQGIMDDGDPLLI